jgi:hypothetical protein
MDLSKLSLGSKVVGAAGLLLLIDSFLHWQEIDFGPISSGVTMWHGWGVLVGLTLLAILAWEAAQVADMKIAVGPLSPSMVSIVLSGLLVLFTLIKILADDYVAVWAWIGLVLSIAVLVGAWLKMQESGETLADLKATVGSAASRSDAAPAAPAAPASPAAEPEAPEAPLDAPS